MKRTLMGGLLAAATLLGGLALTSAAASATSSDEQPPTEVCYTQDRELLYQRSVPTYGDVIEKETRTRTWVEGEKGQHYSWTGGRLEVDNPPTEVPPSDNWQANTHQEPHNPQNATWPNGAPGLHYTANSQGFASWFYFTPGTEGYWGEWGPWTDWPGAGPVNDDGRDRGPLPHGEGEGWQREYRYVVVGQFQNGSTTETSEWLPESAGPPEGEGWKVIDERSVDGEQIPCEEQPADFTMKRKVAEPCTEVGQTTTTVTVYAQDWTYQPDENFEWVAVEDGDEYVAKTYERDLTDDEKADCLPETTTEPLPMVTTSEWVDGTYECDDTTVTQTRVEVTTPYVLVNGVWELDTSRAVSKTQTQERDLTTVEFEACANVLPPLPPAVSPAAPGQAVPPAAPTQLPSTGSSTWVMALMALAAVAGGSGLLRLSRRTTD